MRIYMNFAIKLKWLFILILFFLIDPSVAQINQIDSLKSILSTLKEDTNKVNTLNELSFNVFSNAPEEAIEYGKAALNLAQELEYPKGVAFALKHIGLGYYMQGNYIEVLNYWERSLHSFELLGDMQGYANILNNLGAVYYNQGDDAKAIEYYLQSLETAEKIDDNLRILTALQNIGAVYLNKDETAIKALPYFRQALPLSRALKDQEAIGIISVNLGEAFFIAGEYDSALFYFEKSLALDNKAYYIPFALNNLGKVYSQKGDYTSSVKLQQEAIEIAKEQDQTLELSQAYIGLAETYMAQGRNNKAVETFNNALFEAQKRGYKNEIKDVYEGLATSYAKLSDYQNAFKYQELYSSMKDTLYSIETDDKIKGLQFSYEIEKKQDEIDLLAKTAEIEQLNTKRQKAISTGIGIVGLLILIMALGIFHRYKFINRTNKIIEAEKDRSENLLLNILPHETAEELKQHGEAKARRYDMVSILFTDFKGFTAISATLSPEELVKEIHHCYKAFDEIVTRHGIEKIKTIGDAYMAAGGLPVPNETHPMDVIKAAIEIRDFMANLRSERDKNNQPFFDIRIGIHSGPVVAGIVGTKKFAYDIWGNTVNIASRMESNSEPGKINISETTYQLVKDQFVCTPRGKINVKGGGDKSMYFVEEEVNQMAEMG